MKKGSDAPDGEKNVGRKLVAPLRNVMQFIASDITAVDFLSSYGLHNPSMIVSINLFVCIHFGSKRGLGGI